MNVPATWQCPNCGEQHREEFDFCWKCGTNLVGQRDPEFRISEPIRESDQASESPHDCRELPVLQLPLITYFSIPPLLCYSLFTMRKLVEQLVSREMPNFRFSLADIAVYCIAIILIVIPGIMAMIRAEFFRIIRRQEFSSRAAAMNWSYSIYQLPESVRRSYRWFVPIYYGSIATWVIGLFVLTAWHFLRQVPFLPEN